MKNLIKKILIILILNNMFFSINLYSFADDIEDIEFDSTAIETSISDEKELKLNARSCIVLDRPSKTIIYGKNEFKKVKMASTTKIMTATIILENCDLKQTVEVSKKAAHTGGSRLGLKTGDKITIRDLLYGLMLCSGNDAAVALAETCSGSVSEFSKLMNQKAIELGLSNTHFETPHGLDSDNHYTTAYELALLSNYALNNQTFYNIVGTKNINITINGHTKNISNTNELLGNLLGVYGIKTGFTNGANRCLVTACNRNNMDIICVVLGCDTKKFRTQDSIKLIEYTFKNYEYVDISEIINQKYEDWKNENINNFNIYKGTSNEISLKLSNLDTPIIPIRKNELDSINTNININTIINPPISENTVIGSFTLSVNNCTLKHLDVLIENSINKKGIYNYLYEFFVRYSFILNSFYKSF